MKKKELRSELQALSPDELRDRARALGEELMKLRFRKSSGQLEQGHRISEAKRNLARVETFLRMKRQPQKEAARSGEK